MDTLLLQLLNGLDKGGAYALIALGLTLVFGTLGVVNFAHGALFMLGAFVAVGVNQLLTISRKVRDESITAFEAYTSKPFLEVWFGDVGATIIEFSVPISALVAVPVMLLIGLAMERGLIQYFYKRTHAEQILVTFGLAIVLGEVIKQIFGASAIPQSAPDAVAGAAPLGAMLGLSENLTYPWWRLVYLLSAFVIVCAVFAFLKLTTYGMVVRAGMTDREMVGLLGINIQRRFTVVFGIAAIVAGVAGCLYTPILPPDYHIGMNFLVLSFVVVVVGGMGSLGGAVSAGFLLGVVQSFASMSWIKDIVPGIDQIIIYLIAVIVLLTRPRGLMGRKGVMEG